MNYWFTSDTHLGHANIIKYCNRPFETIEKMNERLIHNWNERVKPDDIVFHLGDFCFKSANDRGEGQNKKAKEWEEKLNGRIILICGNHDGNNSAKSIIKRIELCYCKRKICLVHEPCDADPCSDLTLAGHVHEKLKFGWFGKSLWINVGVDQWNFYPINIQEILKFESKIRKGEVK